ncbi:MAG TPA: alanine racemase, partial [Nocardioides sp.]|nr:alanine racemase [Nocardioides sp.]
MSLTLTVDGERWRAHLHGFAERHPGLVPVAKGNGYGFTLGRLARRAEWLGADTLAVGTYEELPEVASRFDGDILVLTPWRPFIDDLDPGLADRVIHNVGRTDDLDALLDGQPRA